MKTWHLILMLPEMALNKGGGYAAGMGPTLWRSCILENESIVLWEPSWGRYRRLPSPITRPVSTEGQEGRRGAATVRDKSKVLVGGFPICLKDAIHPEGPLAV